MSDGLPPIDASRVPRDVRDAGPKAERVYGTALAFESVLLQELTQSLGSTLGAAGSTGGGFGDDGASDAASALTAQMIPDALTRSLTASGGIGLARQLYRELGGAGAANAHGHAAERSRT